jgi:hypothetical protein
MKELKVVENLVLFSILLLLLLLLLLILLEKQLV